MRRIAAACALLAATSGAALAETATEEPGSHGMFMVGEETLFLLHMPMFHNPKHMYQVVLRARLPDAEMAQYRKLRAANPDTPYNLINTDANLFILPELKSGEITDYQVTVFDGYSNAGGGTPGPVLWDNVTLTVDEVVVFRHFTFSINRPETLTYLLFGAGDEAHMSHFIARDPSFQHIVTLDGPPDWLAPAQVAAGVVLEFPDLASEPVSCAPPLAASAHRVLVETVPDWAQTLTLSAATPTVWYSTGNLLNTTDPCPE